MVHRQMTIYRLVTFILLLFLLPAMATGQTKNKKRAKKYFNDYSFEEAIEKYKNVKHKDGETLRRLAEAYKYTGNTDLAEAYYLQLVTSDYVVPDDYLHYAEMLKANRKYHKVEEYMKLYNKEVPGDSRVERYLEDPNYFRRILDEKGKYRVKNVSFNSPYSDFGPAFYKDSSLVFTSSRPKKLNMVKREYNWNKQPFLDLYVAKKDSNYKEFESVSVFSQVLNTKMHEGPASFTKKFDKVYFGRNNYHLGKEKTNADKQSDLKIYISTPGESDWNYEKFANFSGSEHSVMHPFINRKGNKLYFASNNPMGYGGYDIWAVDVHRNGSFGEPYNLGSDINSEGNEVFPYVLDDGTLFFTSDGLPGLGGLDVFIAPFEGGKYAKVYNMGVPINSNKDDFSLIINQSKKAGYFASNRPKGKGDDDIYSFKVLNPLSFKKIIKGITKGQEGEIVRSARVVLRDQSGKILNSVKTDNKGIFIFDVSPGQLYSITGNRRMYMESKIELDPTAEGDTVFTELLFEKYPEFQLKFVIKRKGASADSTGLYGVNMTLMDKKTGIEQVIKVNGGYIKDLKGFKLGESVNYHIKLEKKGYETRELDYTRVLDEDGKTYMVDGEVDLEMVEIKSKKTPYTPAKQEKPVQAQSTNQDAGDDWGKSTDDDWGSSDEEWEQSSSDDGW